MLRQWYSLRMLHRTCKNMHKGVRLGGLSMPSSCCNLYMSIYFKPWGIKGPRPRGTTMVPPPAPQLEPPHPQPGSSGDTPAALGVYNLGDPSHRWVKNLSSTP